MQILYITVQCTALCLTCQFEDGDGSWFICISPYLSWNGPHRFAVCSSAALLWCCCQYVCSQAASEPWCPGSYLQHRWVGVGVVKGLLCVGQCRLVSAGLPPSQWHPSLSSLLPSLPACLSVCLSGGRLVCLWQGGLGGYLRSGLGRCVVGWGVVAVLRLPNAHLYLRRRQVRCS